MLGIFFYVSLKTDIKSASPFGKFEIRLNTTKAMNILV